MVRTLITRSVLPAAVLLFIIIGLSLFHLHGIFIGLLQIAVVAVLFWMALRGLVLGPVRLAAEWLRNRRLGKPVSLKLPLSNLLFEPLAAEINRLTESLTEARASAEKEARLRHTRESLWTPERLKEHVRHELGEDPLIVVSNREPYVHTRRGKQIEWSVPPSGLVTALEPILRACGGMWVAQATGDGDRETADASDHVQVPPEEPQYTLRRIWISEQEEKGFYYGFANEGLWPLCHIAHTRPLFRAEDWEAYQSVNRRFAEVVLEEIKNTAHPCILVQDYHFALLPQMIKEKRPDARVALFWHIPWPNPESFGICPWRRELLQGMLGADLLGFHIQYHCNNFLDTVDRTLEARVDRERFAVVRRQHATRVKPFPISVAFTATRRLSPAPTAPPPDKQALLSRAGVTARYLGVGVDRIDYTKGIKERFLAIERCLDLFPEYQGQFAFVELAAPSRSLIPRYRDLVEETEAEAERINARFRTSAWRPIVFLKKQHSQGEIEPFYKAADVCLVTSLHDGMNLVAKEFVAARDQEDGVLILSTFTGAARELRDALIINPYDIEQMAQALHQALTMPSEEAQARMRRMRDVVRDHNIYRWGANLITELSQLRPAASSAAAYLSVERPPQPVS